MSKITPLNSLKIPCSIGSVSDGYHTFDELYEHRCTLFLALMLLMRERAWFSKLNADGGQFVGWFLAGIKFPAGQCTYHLPDTMWKLAIQTGAENLDRAPEWDGHTPQDVVNRIQKWISGE